MAETSLTDSAANALGGTTDSQSDLVYPTIGESPYYTTLFRLIDRVLTLAKVPGNSLRAYRDGDLTFGVRAGRFMDGGAARDFAGAAAQALTNNATNYVYLDPGGTLHVNTTGFPATPHLPLASIVTAGGSYGPADITDCRGRAIFQPVGGLSVSAGAEAADTRAVTIQGGSGPAKVRVWIAASDFGPPSATGNTVSVSAGTVLREITANADYELITTSAGTAAMNITVSGAASRYVLAEVDGRVYSSGEIAWT